MLVPPKFVVGSKGTYGKNEIPGVADRYQVSGPTVSRGQGKERRNNYSKHNNWTKVRENGKVQIENFPKEISKNSTEAGVNRGALGWPVFVEAQRTVTGREEIRVPGETILVSQRPRL